MDLMAYRLGDGWAFRLLTMLEDFNSEGVGMVTDVSLPAARIAARMILRLNCIIERRDKREVIRVGNCPSPPKQFRDLKYCGKV